MPMFVEPNQVQPFRVRTSIEPLAGMGDLSQGMASPEVRTAIGVASVASAGLSAYHGYIRNNESLGWALGWGILGSMFPVITPAIALAQGFGKPRVRKSKASQ